MTRENYGREAGDGIKGIFHGINNVGEELRNNFNGFCDSGGDAVASRKGTRRDSHGRLHNVRDTHYQEEPHSISESDTTTAAVPPPVEHNAPTVPPRAEHDTTTVHPVSDSPRTSTATAPDSAAIASQNAKDHPDAENYRHSLNGGVENMGKKLDGWLARHGHGKH